NRHPPDKPPNRNESQADSPVGAISQALSTAWFSDEFPLLQLVVLATYAVGLSALAARLFRWD
ncbi:ABC transporter permease, partial [Agromyces sp. LY-1074]|nr:ABC transporter permease [Agromyces sp. LY-1074]MDR5708013.1 ABC transporter permease [Agromyces sp. LY-1358]